MNDKKLPMSEAKKVPIEMDMVRFPHHFSFRVVITNKTEIKHNLALLIVPEET
jgi:hypothetical protein